MILHGDCLDVLRSLPENSVDSIVTDPPYGWRFMGKAWDGADIEKMAKEAKRPGDTFVGTDGVTRKTRNQPAIAAGKYDLSLTANQAFQEFSREWATEAYRVLKPGGHMLVFCGPRTYHRMASGVEDAGFEIRDQIQWLFGSGFPKSLDISKAIDKAAGAERRVISEYQQPDIRNNRKADKNEDRLGSNRVNGEVQYQSIKITVPSTDTAKTWQGFGTALKPANEPIVLARKPLSEKTVAANVLKWGCGGLNIDVSRIATDRMKERQYDKESASGKTGSNKAMFAMGEKQPRTDSWLEGGRFPANLIFSHSLYCTDTQCDIECAVNALDEQSGILKQGIAGNKSRPFGNGNTYGTCAEFKPNGTETYACDVPSGASRFFYCAKISTRERNEGLGDQKSSHPTVKPKKLMSYLIKLVTPPGGTVLDPFTGSGSTGVAAIESGFKFLGIEKEAEYHAIALKRLKHAHASLITEEV